MRHKASLQERLYISPGQSRVIFCHLQLYSDFTLLTLTSGPACSAIFPLPASFYKPITSPLVFLALDRIPPVLTSCPSFAHPTTNSHAAFHPHPHLGKPQLTASQNSKGFITHLLILLYSLILLRFKIYQNTEVYIYLVWENGRYPEWHKYS